MKRITELNRGFQYIDNKIKSREKAIIAKSGLGITHRELMYLVIVHDNEGKTLTEILGSSGVTKATLSNQVKLLVNKGFVRTESDLKDTRRKKLYLTKTGKEAYALHEQIRDGLLSDYREVLSEKEIDKMVDLGRKILNKIKEKENV